jgi:hypothetical protein
MLVEPDLDRRELAAALDRHHGLAPLALRFVPAGETAWCYRLTDRHGGVQQPCPQGGPLEHGAQQAAAGDAEDAADQRDQGRLDPDHGPQLPPGQAEGAQ